MATIAVCRGALRRNAVPLGLSLSTGIFLFSRQPPTRLDALPSFGSRSPSAPAASHAVEESKEWLNPEVIRQLSGGSLAGQLHEDCTKTGNAILTSDYRLRDWGACVLLFKDTGPAHWPSHRGRPSKFFAVGFPRKNVTRD